MLSSHDSIDSFKSKKILVIAPHCQTFIKDQLSLISQRFENTTVLLPQPYISALALRVPYVKKQYSFLRLNTNSLQSDLNNCSIVPSRFFTLPIEVIRRRNFFLASESCEKTVSKHKIDFNLIHTHFLENGYIAMRLKAKYNAPLIVTAHGVDVYDLPFRNSWYNMLIRHVLAEADQIITVSRSNETKLLELGVSPKKLHIIPNGYDEKIFKPLCSFETKKKLGLPFNKKVLISVGNLVTVKGHTDLIDAFSIVAKKHKDLLLIIIGSGPLRQTLQNKVTRLGLTNKVTFLGGKSHDEIPIWINSSDIFVLPSRNEGFPTVIPEAMACGKPVVGTNVGGIPEALSNEDIGVLANPQDPKSLANAIVEAIDKNWRSEVIINHAQQYSWTRLVARILNVYSLCCSSSYVQKKTESLAI
jgi:glycosyltransferase involved in cell wall biosynthesis